MTYDMNILQGLDAPETFCVTLNETDGLDPDKILGHAGATTTRSSDRGAPRRSAATPT